MLPARLTPNSVWNQLEPGMSEAGANLDEEVGRLYRQKTRKVLAKRTQAAPLAGILGGDATSKVSNCTMKLYWMIRNLRAFRFK